METRPALHLMALLKMNVSSLLLLSSLVLWFDSHISLTYGLKNNPIEHQVNPHVQQPQNGENNWHEHQNTNTEVNVPEPHPNPDQEKHEGETNPIKDENKLNETNAGPNVDSVEICKLIFDNAHFKNFCGDEKMKERYNKAHVDGTNVHETPYDKTVKTEVVGEDPNHQALVHPIDDHTVDQAVDHLFDVICTQGVQLSCMKILE